MQADAQVPTPSSEPWFDLWAMSWGAAEASAATPADTPASVEPGLRDLATGDASAENARDTLEVVQGGSSVTPGLCKTSRPQ